jgi:hypothetical protein
MMEMTRTNAILHKRLIVVLWRWYKKASSLLQATTWQLDYINVVSSVWISLCAFLHVWIKYVCHLSFSIDFRKGLQLLYGVCIQPSQRPSLRRRAWSRHSSSCGRAGRSISPSASRVRPPRRTALLEFTRGVDKGLFHGGSYHSIPLLENDQYERIWWLRLIVYHHICTCCIGWYTYVV